MSFEEKLKKLNISLPAAADPVGSYVATKITGKLLFISGQISIDENGNLIKGKLGNELDTKAGYEAAKRCALNIVSQAKKACDGNLSKIKSVFSNICSSEEISSLDLDSFNSVLSLDTSSFKNIFNCKQL